VDADLELCTHGLDRRSMLLGGLGAAPASLVLPALLSSIAAPHPAHAAEGLRLPSSAERAAIEECLKKVVERPKAPVLLRLPFHDAGTFSISGSSNGGANASVRFELERPENKGLKRGWRVIEQLAKAIEGTPAGSVVSLADLVMLAGAYAVELCNGPKIELRIGRPDAPGPDPEGRLPDENSSAALLKANFADKGFSAREFVALSGAHTIGNKGFGGPYAFDNTYYKELLKKPWTNTKDSMASMIGLPSDHVLPDDAELQPIIQEYAKDQEAFYKDFSAAYIKLSELGVR